MTQLFDFAADVQGDHVPAGHEQSREHHQVCSRAAAGDVEQQSLQCTLYQVSQTVHMTQAAQRPTCGE